MFNTKTDEKIDELAAAIEAAEVDFLERGNYRLSDAIREGSSVTDMAHGWGDGAKACALHSAVIAAKARKYF
jgi:hypothetical protein